MNQLIIETADQNDGCLVFHLFTNLFQRMCKKKLNLIINIQKQLNFWLIRKIHIFQLAKVLYVSNKKVINMAFCRFWPVFWLNALEIIYDPSLYLLTVSISDKF